MFVIKKFQLADGMTRKMLAVTAHPVIPGYPI